MWIALFFMMAARFWESKPPAEWTERELEIIVSDSPWAQSARASATAPEARIYLATAEPMRLAEKEMRRRYVRAGKAVDEMHEEYELFLRENASKAIVVAINLPAANFPTDGAEIKNMEQECVLKIGRRKFKLAGHFPPSPTDPYLRLAFPREVRPEDKDLDFQLYIPGLSSPFREVRFVLKELRFKDSVEF
jgi:hypothetical protein